ncbi:MAG: SAM-dependent DNA methyltransferase [Chloroflexi bacterium]|nr:SAM-dependent DNA methyltransferase [Chloroflexota bacterium]
MPRKAATKPQKATSARTEKEQRSTRGNGATLGIEAQLWQAADKMRGHLDAAEYKNVVLGLIFLKYISDAFEQLHSQLVARQSEGADPEDRDEYTAERVFWVPKEARWERLKANAKQPTIGNLIDDAMAAIERDNPSLRGVLPGNYGRATLDKQRLGGLVDLISGINFVDEESRKQDVLGRVYEYFLSQFASAEGKKGGEFYTPRSVVRVLVEMLSPYKGRVFDPCCGSGGMFVQSEKFVEAHGGRIGDISIYGQESNPNTWKLAKMNLAIRGIEGDLKEPADSFLRDLHPDLKADFILANPPFNMSDWGGENLREDKRWKYGVPPVSNANFAWVQHFIYHLSPKGRAGFVLANGSMSSNTSGEGEIRKAIIEDDLVDCMVALPGQLFYSTQIPVCLWFLARDKAPHPPLSPHFQGKWGDERGVGGQVRDRRGEVLFIDARKLGYMVDRVHRDLSEEDIALLANTYHAWRGLPLPSGEGREGEGYRDIPGFCKSVTLEEIRAQGYVLTPGRYVGAAEAEEDDEPFEQKMARLTKELEAQFEEGARLEEQIRENLKKLAYVG